MTKGLPSSGKSTWAKEEVIHTNGKTKRVNKDDLRAMIDAGNWSKDREKHILEMRDTLVKYYLTAGYSVIVDDTNLAYKHEMVLRGIAREFNADFEIKDFTDIPYSVCIERDMGRANKVGAKVIMAQYNQFLKPESPKYNFRLRDAIICDIDGTLALIRDRNPYDASNCMNDDVERAVAHIVNNVPGTVLLVSGRENKYRKQTELWLLENGIRHKKLYMRETADRREDSIVKKEIYEREIKDKYNVLFVLDDRNRVVDMWRSLGLKCLQVEEGYF